MSPPFTRHIVGGLPVQMWKPTQGDAGFAAFEVPSSKDVNVTYTVIMENDGTKECSCKSFYYRAYCRHLDVVRQALKKK